MFESALASSKPLDRLPMPGSARFSLVFSSFATRAGVYSSNAREATRSCVTQVVITTSRRVRNLTNVFTTACRLIQTYYCIARLVPFFFCVVMVGVSSSAQIQPSYASEVQREQRRLVLEVRIDRRGALSVARRHERERRRESHLVGLITES